MFGKPRISTAYLLHLLRMIEMIQAQQKFLRCEGAARPERTQELIDEAPRTDWYSGETAVRFSDASLLFTTPPHRATIMRWGTTGRRVCGRTFVLQIFHDGACWYTTKEAIRRWQRAIQDAIGEAMAR